MFIECVAEETASSVGLYVERLVRMLLNPVSFTIRSRFPQTPSGGSQNQPVVHEADVEEQCRWHHVGEHQRTLTMRDFPAFDPSPQRARVALLAQISLTHVLSAKISTFEREA